MHEAVEWTCPACILRKPRGHPDHTEEAGECRWFNAPYRRARGHYQPRAARPRAARDSTQRLGAEHGA
eukprot:4742572-Amphidinium_carterae.1